MVFGWTKQRFPFTVKSVHDLTIAEHVVTVTSKAFYDIAHAPADHSNRRHSPKDYAVWEIHPVMKPGSDSMKDWEIIADNLKKRGWSLSYGGVLLCMWTKSSPRF